MGQSPPGHNVIDLDGGTAPKKGLPFVQGNAEFTQKSPLPVKWCKDPLKVAQVADILLSVRAPIGATNRADTRLAIGRGLAAVRFSVVDSRFAWHLCNHAKKGFQRVTQGSTFPAIGATEVKSLPILLRPLAEQRAIAAVLDSIDEAIERTEAVIAATEQLRDSLLHELLTRGVPGWHTEWKEVPGLGTIPADWQVVRLGHVCHLPEYGAGASAIPLDPDLPRYVRITALTDDGRLRNDDKRSADPSQVEGYELMPGDLLFARSGATVGKTYMYRAEDGPCVYAGYLIRFRPKVDIALPNYLELFTHSLPYHRWVASMFRAGAQPNINAGEYSSLGLGLPSLDEQDAIVAALKSVNETIHRANIETFVLKYCKESLADALISVRVSTQRILHSAGGVHDKPE